MKLLAVAALGVLLAGCLVLPDDERPDEEVPCADRPHEDRVVYLAAGRRLADAPGAAGSEPADQGHEAFTEELAPWLSEPLAEGMHIAGSVTVRLTFDVGGQNLFSPGPGGTMLLLQFGSDRTYAPWAAAIANGNFVTAGTRHVAAVPIDLPSGGFTFEAGDRVALLVTSLVEGGTDPGVRIHFGGDSESGVRFRASCLDARTWTGLQDRTVPVALPGNQGLFTGVVPAEQAVNRIDVPLELEAEAARLTVELEQEGASGPKDDMDLYLLGNAGTILWQAASPAADERMVLWPENLDRLASGPYRVRVESYSGVAYSGVLRIVTESVQVNASSPSSTAH
jgi:hypothetical protein